MAKSIDPLSSPGFLVGRIAHALHLRVNESLKAEGISHSVEEVSILMVLNCLESPERAGLLAELLGRDISTLTRQLDGLVEAGLVSRKKCSEDGRAVIASITAKGKRLLKRTTPQSVAMRDRAMKGIAKKEQEQLSRLLSKMLENLRS